MKLTSFVVAFCAFGILKAVRLTDTQEKMLVADIELDEFEFEELCAPTVPFQWDRIIGIGYNSQRARATTESFANTQREMAKKFTELLNDDSPTRDEETARKLDLITQPGDVLLPANKYQQLLGFTEEIQDIIANKRKDCNSSPISCDLTSSDPDQLMTTWKKLAIVGQTNEIHKRYPRILDLVNDAAKENGSPDAESYWLMLSDLENNGYQEAKDLWEDVKPLYKRFHSWVLGTLKQHYGSKVIQDGKEGRIPSFLLGSSLGYDWTSIADIILTNECRRTLDQIQTTLEKNDLKGKRLYEKAETLTGYLQLGKLSKGFWLNSKFDQSCPATVVNPCWTEPRVSTCNTASWSNFLDAHEIVMESIHSQTTEMDSLSFVLKNGNRHSAVYDGVVGVASILASSRHYLAQYGLISISDECSLKVVMTLTALRVLPLLPYYLVADLSRLEAIKTNKTDNIAAIWHQFQYDNDMQGISTPEQEWWGFLEDPHVSSNQPYISKFYAVFLQFHLWEALMIKGGESFGDVEEFIHNKEEFSALLASGMSRKWPKLIEKIFKIKRISSAPLLRFFEKLDTTLSDISSNPSPTKPTRVTSTTKTGIGHVIGEVSNDLKQPQDESKGKEVTNTPTTSGVKEGYDIGSYVLIVFLVVVGILVLTVIFKFVWKKTRKNYRPPSHQNQVA